MTEKKQFVTTARISVPAADVEEAELRIDQMIASNPTADYEVLRGPTDRPEFVPVSTRFWRNDHQERWNFESIFRICGETVRVRIQRDTYVFQSHAYGEVFDPNSRDWKIVTSVPYSQMETVSNIHPGARSGDVAPVAFETDEEILLYQVSMILGNDYRGVVQDAIMQKHTWQESETFEESDMIEERWEQEQQ